MMWAFFSILALASAGLVAFRMWLIEKRIAKPVTRDEHEYLERLVTSLSENHSARLQKLENTTGAMVLNRR